MCARLRLHQLVVEPRTDLATLAGCQSRFAAGRPKASRGPSFCSGLADRSPDQMPSGTSSCRTCQAAAGEASIRLGTTITRSTAGCAATSGGAAAASTAQAISARGNRSRSADATGSVCTQSPIADSRVIRIRGWSVGHRNGAGCGSHGAPAAGFTGAWQA